MWGCIDKDNYGFWKRVNLNFFKVAMVQQKLNKLCMGHKVHNPCAKPWKNEESSNAWDAKLQSRVEL